MERFRHFNLVINKGAESYEYVRALSEGFKNCRYAYILHDKDTLGTGELKNEHIHLVLSFDNARSFESVLKAYPGAHIEKALNLKSSLQYLLHKNDKTKHQYTDNEIITNDTGWLKSIIDSTTYPILDENAIIRDLLELHKANKMSYAIVHFYLTYGNEQTKTYRIMIKDLIENISGLSTYTGEEGSSDIDLPF